uniref:NS2 protein n=1 Tax=Tenuivirus oryzaclavatae TaxID=3052763 RepID=I6TLP9_9VIRU|nr:NS2 protein [Tenuivirus oryzaclavatae]
MALLLFNDHYYGFLHKYKRHTGSYDNLFNLRCSKEDHYLNSLDAIWLMGCCEEFTDPALRAHALAIATESNIGLVNNNAVISDERLKCWLCKKPSHQQTEHLKLILLPNLVNGFQFATESYHICLKDHSGDDPTQYLSEFCFPTGLRAYYKPHQKMEHKHIVVTNGIPISKNFNEIALPDPSPSEDYVLVGAHECPILM